MKKIVEMMTYLDDEYIKEAEPEKAFPLKKIRRRLASGWISLVACVAAVSLITLSIVSPRTYVYTADEISNCFGITNGVATNAYEKLYVPSYEYLNIGDVEYNEYISIYIREIQKNIKLNEEEIISFTSGILSRFFKEAEYLTDEEIGSVTDKVLAEFFKEKGIEYKGSASAKTTVSTQDMAVTQEAIPTDAAVEEDKKKEESNNFNIYVSQGVSNYIFIDRGYNADESEPIILGDVRLEVDQLKNDKELIEDIEDIKKKLFEIFGTTFNDVRIERYYNSYSKNGVSNLKIIFYNEHPLDKYVIREKNFSPLSDSITIKFEESSTPDISGKTEDFLTDASISYVNHRIESEDLVKKVKEVKMITLEEAEEFLKKGYVFGNHSCPLCMSMQEKIDFEDYDFVEIINFTVYEDGKHNEYIPFYAFYKFIRSLENGRVEYGVTYVPAIEVKDYEDYFEKQTAKHPI